MQSKPFVPSEQEMEKKVRLDKLLFDLKLAPSRERAQAYIMAGKVLVGDVPVSKAGTKVLPDADIRLRGVDQPFVGRGGVKLEAALDHFPVPVKGRICMDIGASTGGFTDCLLQRGAVLVFAIDAGRLQLDYGLSQDRRVISLEKCNFRHLEMEQVGSFVDLAVVDVSFISLTKILPKAYEFLCQGGHLVALVKPQFEAGPGQVEKGGLVQDPAVQKACLEQVRQCAQSLGFADLGSIPSPIQGKKKGNQEFLLHLQKS